MSSPAKESSLRRQHRMPGGFPHRTIALAAFVAVAISALLLGALRHQSLSVFIGLGLSIPVVIMLLARLARRQRDRVRPSR
jgi:hypothetical protein